MKKLIITVLYVQLFLLSGIFTVSAQSFGFENVPLDAKASTVHAFAQDSLGLLWLGSNNGLYNYDGYTLHMAPGGKPEYQTYIYSIAVLDDSRMALATERGVFFYNYRKDCYEDLPGVDVSDVRSLLLVGDTLWIGSLKGLYTYHLKKKTFFRYMEQQKLELTDQIYALAKRGSKVLVGTYNGLFELTPETAAIQRLALPAYRAGANQFINALLVFDETDRTYIGTEYGLYIYEDGEARLLDGPLLQKLPVKSLAKRDAQTLLIGTDDGLFVYRPQQQELTRIKHDARNPHSLANNIIWSVFTSHTGDVWIGTDLGFSGWKERLRERRFPIFQFTNSSNGNRFYRIWRDRAGWYWLGGDNGLIRTQTFDEKTSAAHWYRMDAAEYALPHNRVRDIYEDRDGLLWIASDGGVSLFNPRTETFKNFTIVDSVGEKNAKWAYNLVEDRNGNLWVATYMGGIFVVQKEKLDTTSDGYVVGQYYGQSQGLLANYANQLLLDDRNRIWSLFYNRGINTIDPETGKVDEITDEEGNALADAVFIRLDAEGTVWVGQHGKMTRIDKDGEKKSLVFDAYGGEVTAMEDVGAYIWIANNMGVWQVDKKTLHSVLLRYGGSITTMFYRADTEDVLLGGINEVVVLPANGQVKDLTSTSRIVLTAMYINNERFGAGGYGLRYRQEIVLDHQQNNLRLEFSDLDYGNHLGHRLAYAFKGGNETWTPLEQRDNRIQLANLQPGNYTLQVTKVDMLGRVIAGISLYDIKVNYPWYAGVWARIVYSLAALGFLLWMLNFFRVRNKLKWERRERRKVMELSRMKMDFLTAVSHDLKNPLSLILAPVSQLMLKTKNLENKKLLDGVHRNAMKINTLIQEVMTFEKAEEHPAEGELMRSQLDVVEFAARCLADWKEMGGYKHIEMRFSSDRDRLLVQTDASRLESILHNLLANACKYSKSEGPVVELRLQGNENGISIQIQDNGIGIAEKDVPYVFSKFYRGAAEGMTEIDGTGVGLYLVRNYCNQLGWKVELESKWMEGTTVTVHIPVSQVDELRKEEGPVAQKKLLIVEDNEELSSFLLLAFEGLYDCRAVADGRAALDLIDHAFKPDMIVSDAVMPRMDGLEMVRQLRKRNDTAVIPVILLTAAGDEQVQRAWIAAGVDAFMAKPFDLELLKLQMQQLLLKKTTLQTKLRIEELSKPKEEEMVSPDEQLLAKITQIIEDAIDDSDFSVQRLADEVGIGAKQLYRKIKQLTGNTPVTYIRTIRMKKAALLLRQRKFTVAEVMYMVGYTNASYFSKCFQEEFGTTPKNYIEQANGNSI